MHLRQHVGRTHPERLKEFESKPRVHNPFWDKFLSNRTTEDSANRIEESGSPPQQQLPKRQEAPPASDEPPRKKPDRRQTEHDISSTASVLEKVKTDTSRILHILEKPRTEDKEQHVPYDQELLRAARSIDALKSASGQYLTVDESEGLLYCSVCDTGKTAKSGLAVTGRFRYNFSLGSKFVIGKNMPTQFRLMKSSVGKHLKSSGHQKRVEEDIERRESKEAKKRSAKTADMNVLRTAYHVIKESGSGESFSRWIATQSKTGADMGNINHSRALLRDARNAFHQVIQSRLKEYVAKQPCVSLLVDKVTVNRRTLDVTAIMTVVPDAPASHLLQSYVVAAPVVKQHDGDALASEIQETLANIGVTTTEQLAAIGADGQYHRLSVPEKLLRNMRADVGLPSSGPISVAAIWDSAHLMNLADGDARKRCEWVPEVTRTISDISQRLMSGKGLEEVTDMGKKMGVKARRLKLWSGTRFAPHAAKVFEAFLHNWELMSAVLRNRLQEEARKEYAAELLADLKKLKDSSFHARVAALKDVYTIMARGSKEVQQVQSLPWETRRGYASAVASIKCTRTAIEAFVASAPKPVEAAGAVAHADLDELCPTLSRHKAAVRQGTVAMDITAFCAALESALKSRSQGNLASGSQLRGTSNKDVMEAMADIRDVADLQRFRSGRVLPSGVVDASRRLVARRLIPVTAEVSLQGAEAAIRLVAKASEREQQSNQQLLKMLWSRRTEVPELHGYLATCIRLWLISPPESVVENMCSVLGEVFGAHRNLDHESAAKELVIRWNGPEPFHADSIVEAARVVLKKNFKTKNNSVSTVIAGHMARKCPRASVLSPETTRV